MGAVKGNVTDEPMVERLERLEREATPGPWKVEDYGEDEWFMFAFGAGPALISYNPKDSAAFVRSQADAELIALAPALLSQLREQREEIATERRLRMEDGMDKGRLQIALAAAERTVREQREALERAMTLLADADDTYSESLLDSLFDSDDGFALDFYNTALAALAPDTEGEGT